MNKKLLSLAIGAVLAAPMLAQADVKIGGTFNVSADYIDTATGVTPTDTAKTWNVSSNSSFIQIDASEDLGGGMKGVATLQQFFRLDGNAATGASASSPYTTSRMTDGNAFVGLQTGLGLLKAGTHDTLAKQNGRDYDLFGNTLGDSRNLDVNNTRAPNVIAYVSPKMAGVTVAVAHVTNFDNSSTGASSPSQVKANSARVKYEGGPVVAGVAIDILNPGASATADDETWLNVGAGMKFGSARVVVFYQQHDNVGTATTAEKTTMGVGGSFGIGANDTIKAQVYKLTSSVTGSADVESTMIAVGYDHAFSKAFTGYVVYAQTDNDAGIGSGMAGGGHGDNVAAIAGETQTGIGAGFKYSF